MASTTSYLLHVTPLRQVRNAPPASCSAHSPKPAPPPSTAAFPGRRGFLFLLPAALKAAEAPARAQDIPLFGLRRKIEKAEEKVEEVVKKGIETAEEEVEAVEKGLETAEKEVEVVLGFGGLAQAGVVAGAEVFGVLVATSVVNGILGPEGRKS